MTGALIGVAAGVALTLLGQYAAHRMQVRRLRRRFEKASASMKHTIIPYADWPPPEVANRAGSLIVTPHIDREEIDILGRYNAEVARGLQHAPEWRERMDGLQRRFNAPNDE